MGGGILRGRTQRKKNTERKRDQERETYLPREKRETDAGIMREESREYGSEPSRPTQREGQTWRRALSLRDREIQRP